MRKHENVDAFARDRKFGRICADTRIIACIAIAVEIDKREITMELITDVSVL
ncbi:MAG: hypothetical protein H6R26_1539 [Proteobacteria bacterium]|nr:hypothetical protein [Pseudomonadota bacterium]